MNTIGSKFPRSFWLSGVLLILGLCVEAISLYWIHPIAFLAFFLLGGTLLGAGILLYLYSIIFGHPPSNSSDPPGNSQELSCHPEK